MDEFIKELRRRIYCSYCIYIIVTILLLVGLGTFLWNSSSLNTPEIAVIIMIVVVYGIFSLFLSYLHRYHLNELRHYYNLQYEKERFKELVSMADAERDLKSQIVCKELKYIGKYIIGYDEIAHHRKGADS